MSIEEFFNLIAGCLIIFGLSFMFVWTEGPFGLFELIRNKVKSTFQTEWIRNGISCIICASFWLGMPVSYLMSGGVVMWLAGVGFVCAITSLSPGDDGESEE